MSGVLLRPAAAADVEDAYAWYEGQRSGLGEEFLEILRSTLAAIVENPGQYPVVHRGTRRALLRRFPYGVFYRRVEDQVIVVACMHAKRNPRRWRGRK